MTSMIDPSKLPKFAVLSHALPPSPTGQAVILRRLLEGIPADRYCLISHTNYTHDAALKNRADQLPATYYHLRSTEWAKEIHRLHFAFIRQPLSLPKQVKQRAAEIVDILVKERAELLIVCTGDMFDLPSAALAARRLKIPLVVYLFDDYLYQWQGFSRMLAKIIEPMVLRSAQTVIGPNEYLVGAYKRRYGLDMRLLRNLCPIPNLQKITPSREDFDPKDTNIVYAGSVYFAHFDAFRNLLISAAQLQRRLRLHIYTSQTADDLAREGITGPHVVLHPPVPQAEILQIVRGADLLFLPLAFHSAIPEVIKTSAPGKMGEYLALQRPILVHAPADSFVSWYFTKHQAGLVVGVNDANTLAQQLKEFLADPTRQQQTADNARQCAENDFAQSVVQQQFYHLLQESVRQ